MSDKIKAIGYVRVSTEEQAKEGFSLDNQRQDIERLCNYQKWDLIDILDDEGIPGSEIDNRPGIQEVLRRVKDEKIDYLVVWKLSRLSRKMTHIVQIADYLAKNNVYLHTIKDGIDTSTPMGKPFLYFAGIFAELERDSLIVQVKGGMEEKARKGGYNGGKPPLGYDLVDKKLIINKDEAEIIKLIYHEYLLGSGYLAIVDKLKESGYKTRKGKNFSGTGIKEILRNPTYKGYVRWGYRQDWGKKNEDGKRKRKYAEKPIYVEGIHDAIIDEVVFDKVQEIITTNPRHNMKRFQGFHLLSGLLRCPSCGYGMSYQPITSKGKKYHYYTCNQYQNKKTCKPNAIAKKDIEDEFLAIFIKIITEPDFMTTMLESTKDIDTQGDAIKNKIAVANNTIKKLEKNINSLFDELLEGSDDYKQRARDRIEDTQKRIKSLELEVIKEENKLRTLQATKLDASEVIDILKSIDSVFDMLDAEGKQRLIRKVIKSIKLKDKHISEIEFTFGEVLGLEVVSRTVPQVNAKVAWKRCESMLLGCFYLCSLWSLNSRLTERHYKMMRVLKTPLSAVKEYMPPYFSAIAAMLFVPRP